MLIKIISVAVLIALAFALVLRKVNKTADRLHDENDAKPVSEQVSPANVEDTLLEEFNAEVKADWKSFKEGISAARPVQVFLRVYSDAVGYSKDILEYRVKVALVILAAATLMPAVLPTGLAALAGMAIGEELVWNAFTYIREVYA